MNPFNGCGVYTRQGGSGGSGPSGSGTLNYVAKWTPNGTTLGNSQLFDDGTNVGLGTITAAHYYDVVKAQDDITTVNITNSNAGTAASSRFRLFNGTSSAVLQHFGTAYASTGANFANGTLLSSSGVGGMSIVTSNASGDLRFYVGQATTISARFLASNGFFGVGVSPTAAGHFQGSGTTNATFGLKVQTGGGTPLVTLQCRDDGSVYNLGGGSISTNTAYGAGALKSTNTQGNNVAVGFNAMTNSVDSDFSVAIGSEALTVLTTGRYNTAIGYRALYSNQTASGSVAIGYRALNSMNSGSTNIAIGANAMLACDGGSNNIGIGESSLINLTTGNFNVSLFTRNGSTQALTSGSRNIFIGLHAGIAIDTGNYNICIGTGTNGSVTSGNFSIAIGESAGENASGSSNIFLGPYAGQYETGSNKFFIDNQSRTTEQNARNSSLLYAKFDSTSANQILVINGKLYLKNTVSNSNYYSGELVSGVLTWTDTGSANAPA